MSLIEVEKKHSFAHVVLNRPEKRNAFNKEMIQGMRETILELDADDKVKLIIIKGAGDGFSAGADLEWMKEQINNTYEQNVKESEEMFEMFWAIKSCTKPVITYVHKYAFGGALGIVAASDYCFAEDKSLFCFSETKMGLAPSVISSFVLSKCHIGLAQPLMMFAENFGAATALRVGLVHKVGESSALLEDFNKFLKHLESLDLDAVKETKKIINEHGLLNESDFKNKTTSLISKLRVSESAQYRLKTFLEKKSK